MKKLLLVLMLIIGVTSSAYASVDENVAVTIPDNRIKINNQVIDNTMGEHPIFEYNGVTYIPMINEYLKTLAITSEWQEEKGLFLSKSDDDISSYLFNQDVYGSSMWEPESTLWASEVAFDVFIDGNKVTDTTYPILMYQDIVYLPMNWDISVTKLGLQSKFENGIFFIYKKNVDPSINEKTQFYIKYSDAYYVGEINENREPHGKGILKINPYKVYTGTFVNNELNEFKLTYDIDSNSQKNVYWKDRNWVEIGYTNEDDKNEKISTAQNELEQLKIEYDKVNKEYNDLSSDLISYWVQGDVILENNESIYIYGQAYGFGAGMCKESQIRIKKPTSGTNLMGMYSGSHIYIGEEYSGGVVVQVYEDEVVSNEVIELRKKRREYSKSISKLESELEELTKYKAWWEYPYFVETKNDKNVFYNQDGLYTVEINGSLKIRPVFYDYTIDIESDEISVLEDLYYNNIEELNYYIENNILDDKGERAEQFINEENGVSDAYIKYGKKYDASVNIYLIVEEKNMIIRLTKMVKNEEFDEAMDGLKKVIDSLIMYYAVG